MKITNNGVSQTALTPAQQVPGAAPSARDTQVEGAAPTNDAYTPSLELLRLVDLLKQEPEVRADRVRDVTLRLQNGDYFSPASAAQTADAILNSVD